MKLNRSAIIALSLTASLATINFPLQASQLTANRVFFRQSPRLLEAYSTFSGARVPGAKYYFNFNLPEQAGESLEKLIIQQRSGFEKIDFSLDRTLAFIGKPNDRGAAIPIENISIDPETRAIEIIFAAPIAPGTNFSIGLRPKRNPQYGGVYIFGVTAFPLASQSNGSYLGIGRFHFYRNGGDVN